MRQVVVVAFITRRILLKLIPSIQLHTMPPGPGQSPGKMALAHPFTLRKSVGRHPFTLVLPQEGEVILDVFGCVRAHDVYAQMMRIILEDVKMPS
jgi:hypothetical protein